MFDGVAEDWLKEQFEKHLSEEAARIGRFNLALFGKTGVGKSTLTNAIFGENVARTGIGEPVTQGAHLYLHESGFLGVIDTRGLEIGQDTEKIIGEFNRYVSQMRKRSLSEQIHVAWYCVRAGDRRFEDTEADFIRRLREVGIPVILVLTQVPKSGDRFHPDAVELAREIESLDLPIFGSRVFMAMALDDEFTGQSSHGLQGVLDATFRCVPEGVSEALVAAQKIDLNRKRDSANTIVGAAATAAGAAGATPIPFSDAIVLVPIQLGMMARIAHVYDINMEAAALASIAAATSATNLGKSAAGNLLKLVPGFGTIAGGAINAGVASMFTGAMGAAWTMVCVQIVSGNLGPVGEALSHDVIRQLFLTELKEQITKLKPSRGREAGRA